MKGFYKRNGRIHPIISRSSKPRIVIRSHLSDLSPDQLGEMVESDNPYSTFDSPLSSLALGTGASPDQYLRNTSDLDQREVEGMNAQSTQKVQIFDSLGDRSTNFVMKPSFISGIANSSYNPTYVMRGH